MYTGYTQHVQQQAPGEPKVLQPASYLEYGKRLLRRRDKRGRPHQPPDRSTTCTNIMTEWGGMHVRHRQTDRYYVEVENGGGKPVDPLPGGVRKPGWVTDMLTFVG